MSAAKESLIQYSEVKRHQITEYLGGRYARCVRCDVIIKNEYGAAYIIMKDPVRPCVKGMP